MPMPGEPDVVVRPLRVAILAFDGMEALDFAGPFEVFTTADRVDARLRGKPAGSLFTVRSVARNRGPLVARAGLRVLADLTFDECPFADVAVVPGGVVDDVRRDLGTMAWLGRVHRNAQVTASVCTGAFVLAEAGVLTSGRVTTHWEDLEQLAREFPTLTVVSGPRWVAHGDVFTSAGISAGIDLSLHVVERLGDGRWQNAPPARWTTPGWRPSWTGSGDQGLSRDGDHRRVGRLAFLGRHVG